MTIEMITEGLGKLLLENHYNASTTKFYEREWELSRGRIRGYGIPDGTRAEISRKTVWLHHEIYRRNPDAAARTAFESHPYAGRLQPPGASQSLCKPPN